MMILQDLKYIQGSYYTPVLLYETKFHTKLAVAANLYLLDDAFLLYYDV